MVIELSQSDVVRAARLSTRHRPTPIGLALLLIVPLLLVILWRHSGEANWPRLLLLTGLIVPPILLGLYLGRRVTAYLVGQRARRGYQTLAEANLSRYELSWDANELRLTYERGPQVIKWHELQAVYQDDQLFVLHLSPVQAVIVPRRTFTSREDEQRFERHLQSTDSLS